MSDRAPTRKSPAAAVLQGLLAGAIGNAIFTGYQRLVGKGEDEESSKPERWDDAPETAQVGHRVAEGVFDKDVPLEKADELANAVHWIYGTSWGGLYALIEESVQNPVLSAPALATGVILADYTLLPLMGLYKPPWRYPAKTLAADYGHHLVYGFAVAGAYRALDLALRRRRRTSFAR